jgi:hypothetical protein
MIDSTNTDHPRTLAYAIDCGLPQDHDEEEEQESSKMVTKVLCVAEKPSIAKAVANHLSNNQVTTVGLQH